MTNAILSPELPWLIPSVTAWLSEILQPQWTVLETGAGGSTVFFAQRVFSVITYEHDPAWAAKVREELRVRKLANVDVRLRNVYPVAGLIPLTLPKLDLAFIDGRGRVRSVIDALTRLKPGGWLVLDDSDRPQYQEAIRVAGTCCGPARVWQEGGDHTTAWQKL